MDILFRRKEIDLFPTSELLKRIEQFPAKTKVGFEHFSQEDLAEIINNLEELCQANRFGVTYQDSGRYWKYISAHCKSYGHDILWLEDKGTWLKHSLALVELEKIKLKDLCREDGESDRDYFKKLVALNEEKHKAQVNLDRIFLLERDEAMLRNIASQGAQVVVAGKGHTDAWVLNKDEIKSKYGIEFG
jgi:hypothetical protein